MPLRSSDSSVLKWPTKGEVDRSARRWLEQVFDAHKELVAGGYFGSYARDDWGVGSDLDLLLIVAASELPFTRRGLAFDTLSLPVPADLVVYTEVEWRRLLEEGNPFVCRLERETVWVRRSPERPADRT
jgi:uncharacterized protein